MKFIIEWTKKNSEKNKVWILFDSNLIQIKKNLVWICRVKINCNLGLIQIKNDLTLFDSSLVWIYRSNL